MGTRVLYHSTARTESVAPIHVSPTRLFNTTNKASASQRTRVTLGLITSQLLELGEASRAIGLEIAVDPPMLDRLEQPAHPGSGFQPEAQRIGAANRQAGRSPVAHQGEALTPIAQRVTLQQQ